jgi:hypothetical protein
MSVSLGAFVTIQSSSFGVNPGSRPAGAGMATVTTSASTCGWVQAGAATTVGDGERKRMREPSHGPSPGLGSPLVYASGRCTDF